MSFLRGLWVTESDIRLFRDFVTIRTDAREPKRVAFAYTGTLEEITHRAPSTQYALRAVHVGIDRLAETKCHRDVPLFPTCCCHRSRHEERNRGAGGNGYCEYFRL